MTPLLPSGLWSVEPGPVISVQHLGEEIRQEGDRHEEGERERKEEGDVLDNDGFNAASHRRALIRAGGLEHQRWAANLERAERAGCPGGVDRFVVASNNNIIL